MVIKLELQIHIAKNIELGKNLSLISNKAPNLLSPIGSEINTVSSTNPILL